MGEIVLSGDRDSTQERESPGDLFEQSGESESSHFFSELQTSAIEWKRLG